MPPIRNQSQVPSVRLLGLVELPDLTTQAGREAAARFLGDGVDTVARDGVATVDRPLARSADSSASGTRAFSPRAFAGANVHHDGHRAGAAAVAGRDPATGITAELFGAEAEVGMSSTRARVGMAKVGWQGDDARNSVGLDVFSVDAGAGTRNKDRSRGVNVGAVANGVGIEGTKSFGGSEFTAGVGLSLGAEASAGVRDIDGDGDNEYCLRVSSGFLTLGGCIEV